MPKAKTHKGLAKRFKVTASGKVRRNRCGKSHLQSHKPAKRVRKLRTRALVDSGYTAIIKRLLQPST